jgi:hypothetical protein
MMEDFRLRVEKAGTEVHIVIICRDEYEAAVMHEDITDRLRNEHGVVIPLGTAMMEHWKGDESV